MYSETNIAEIANYLRDKKNNGQRIALFLGSRTGGLFYNQILYNQLNGWSERNFDILFNIEKFQECYRVMSKRFNEKRFTQTDIYDILISSLGPITYREEDECLVELIKEKNFDIIISTTIDRLLENAFIHQNMKEPIDYRVIIPGRRDDMISPGETKYASIVKVFGDLDLRLHKTVGDIFDLDADMLLKRELESSLAREVLVIGYDSVWDEPVERAFPLQGGSIYYVNEGELPTGAHITQALHDRGGRSCIGDHGSYESFIKLLHRYLVRGDLYNYRTTFPSSLSTEQYKTTIIRNADNQSGANWEHAPLQSIAKPAISFNARTVKDSQEKQEKRTVFVSYSHQDSKYLVGLLNQLKFYEEWEGQIQIDAWSDEKIKPGENWQEKIREALESAKAAVLLISEHFLISKFIREIELPELLSAARANKVTILLVILEPCLFTDTPLSMFQTVNNPKKPLSKMKGPERKETWVEVAKIVKKVIEYDPHDIIHDNIIDK